MSEIRKMIALNWDQQSGKVNQNQKNNQAHKISAVKCGPETPGFSQQQENNQQQEDGSERGRGRRRFRGKRGGRPQAQQAEGEPQAGPSNVASMAQASPKQLNFGLGFMASSAQVPPHTSFYPSFGKAVNLARRLDVPFTTETLKRLEFVEDPKEGSRPLKKRKVIDIDNEVDLDWSGEEDVDSFMNDAAGPSQRCVYNVDSSNSADASSTAELTIALQNSLLPDSTEQDLVSSINVLTLSHGVNIEKEAEWILDSGASRHFTNSLNDFVEFEDCQPVLVRTATSSTFITGKGTVYLKLNDRHLRISPVYYVEDLSARLLSLGQFMQHGLYTRGSICEVALYDERTNKEFVTFHPRSEEDTIYVIKSLVGAEISAHITTIHSIDFEVMHRRMAHPSKEVLQKARKHTKGIPEIEIPREHVCSGCAQGKMMKQPSPPSEKRAMVPFELIHSDLKTLPIESYQKFKYSIIFYDDHTSHAWTINLRTKDTRGEPQFPDPGHCKYIARKWTMY
jgi:hypothetical protein